MSPTGYAILAVFFSYLIGAIPFAYVLVRAVKGIDIRTFGSGNVGATNAGRVLGPKGFLAVFGLDLLKGWLPTIGFPPLVKWLGGEAVPDLPILIAVAAIIGHNFPIYLGFRGGKGVSTSLGAAIGLDWLAAISAVLVFGFSIRISKYMSLASFLGATAFVAVHMVEVVLLQKAMPWDREHLPFTVLILGLYLMLIVRHRKNWRRILDGTEPKIGRGNTPPSGRIYVMLLGILAMIGIISVAAVYVTRTTVLDCGSFTLSDLGRVQTGHQRAMSPVFAEEGKLLAVLCPRYNRLMIYRVDENDQLDLVRDVTLSGQPIAVRAASERFVVLTRPSGDQRHIKSGSIESFDFRGDPIGSAVEVGFYPSDLALVDNGATAIALTLGRSEGDAGLPRPAMAVVDLFGSRVVSRLEFSKDGDQPARIMVSSTEKNLAVSLLGANEVAAIDLADRKSPRLIGRSPLPPRTLPYPSVSGDEWILMPVASDREVAVFSMPGLSEADGPLSRILLSAGPDDSTLEVSKMGVSHPFGQFPLRGAANLGAIRPTGIACSNERSLIAVTSRSGGVHLISVKLNTRGEAAVIANAQSSKLR